MTVQFNGVASMNTVRIFELLETVLYCGGQSNERAL